ncbi:glycosyltransferase [Paenibacillus sp. N1-5-1-14]|uniref:glycosyltransferase family 2 protein n=1 Tax=Paenibacillus radicibacter TaxID=2972488 RepID=UPI002158CA13|nr:glycosyltransferase [Paenibacillus radicibacter]MCR8645190.1 glycosyltransferase [Paenibacillus radicibacter]
MAPLVSVIIPFYNCPYVDQAIASALNQTYPHVEVIVIDDGSTKYANLIKPYRKRVHYIGKANGGTGSALNYGINLAQGEYVVWLSADDRFQPDKISRQLHFMLARQSVISFTNYDAIDKHNRVFNRELIPHFSSDIELYENFLRNTTINGCTVMVKKQLFASVGLFNEHLRYTQDLDMWLRIILSGHRFDFLDESLVLYRFHDEMGTQKNQGPLMSELAAVRSQYNPLLEQHIDTLKKANT